jgi:anti-anti-sigma regulatory factor
MQLSIEVKRQRGASVYICRGQLLRGVATEYLFDLLTRSHEQDVIVDLAEVTAFDEDGLRAIALSCRLLASSQKRLLLRCAPLYIVERLRTTYGAPVLECPNARPATLAASVSTQSSR